MTNNPRVTGVVLAAGESKRLGSPKQLLERAGQTLLEEVVDAVADACHETPLVVLGGHWQEISKSLGSKLSPFCLNPDWPAGMGTSLRVALANVPSNAAGVLVALCDQPAVPTEHYVNLVQQFHKNPGSGIASVANGRRMVPAVAPRASFSNLARPEDSGARQWLRESKNIIEVDCPFAACDIDTESDWQNWLEENAT